MANKLKGKVALLARTKEKGQAVQEEIRSAGGDATFITCDVSVHASVEAAVAQTVNTHGGVHVLVNNAGGGQCGCKAGEPLRLENNATWGRIIAVNLTGPFYMTKAVWPHLTAGGGGFLNPFLEQSLVGRVTLRPANPLFKVVELRR